MAAESIGVLTAFSAGVVSFLAPCVLPLIPGYLSFMTGLSRTELASEGGGRARVLLPSALFVAGFSAVFVLLGAAAGLASGTLGPLIGRYDRLIEGLAGLVVYTMGLFVLGVITVPWMQGEARFDLAKSRRFGRAASFVMGVAFGFGWTPCVGPILGVILGFAAATGDAGRAAVLLGAYSAGLAVPFLVTALFFGRLTSTLAWFTRHSVGINRAAGTVLVLFGVLIATGQLGRVSTLLIRLMPFLGTLG